MNEIKKVYGILEFSEELFCSADSLGCSVDIEFADYPGKLTFPSLPNWGPDEKNPLDKLLIGPQPADKWKEGDHLIFWGKPTSYPKGNSKVKLALLEFPIKSAMLDKATQAIYSFFPNWLNLFEKYVSLFTKQNLINPKHITISLGCGPGSLQLYLINDNELEAITNHVRQPITFIIGNEDVSLHYNQFAEACRLASKQLKPRLEYQLLLDAYLARSNDDYRKVIIEGASALEVSLTARIQEEFDLLGLSFGNKLLDKFRMLTGKFELIRILEIGLPDKDYNALIITPRNNVVHRAYYPDRNSAELFIKEVESLINLFTPKLYEN